MNQSVEKSASYPRVVRESGRLRGIEQFAEQMRNLVYQLCKDDPSVPHSCAVSIAPHDLLIRIEEVRSDLAGAPR